MEESRKREVQDAVRCTEEQWRKVLQAAEEALTEAVSEAATQRQMEAFTSHSDDIQSWIQEQRRRLGSSVGHAQVEERLQVAQVRFDSCSLCYTSHSS